MLKKFAIIVLIGFMSLPAFRAVAADTRIGVVNTERILRDAAPAVRAQKKIEKEFEKRDQEMQRLAKQLQTMQEALEKNAVTMSESEKRNKEREFGEMSRDFQRKQREFREDLTCVETRNWLQYWNAPTRRSKPLLKQKSSM